MIIGLIGQLAAGKGTVTKYLVEKHKAKAVKFSQPLRDMIHRLYVKETRSAMSRLAVLMREEYGSEILVQTLIKDIDRMDVSLAVFDGIRYNDEYRILSARDDFFLWAIDTDIKLRFQRIKLRGENADDKTATFDQFKEWHKLPTEVQISGIMEKADENVDNNGTLKQLYRQIDALTKKYANKN